MTKRATARIVIDVRYEEHYAGDWVIRLGPGEVEPLEAVFDDKKDATGYASRLARDLVYYGALTQVRVFNKNGTISREMTYPRSSDPTRSKG